MNDGYDDYELLDNSIKIRKDKTIGQGTSLGHWFGFTGRGWGWCL